MNWQRIRLLQKAKYIILIVGIILVSFFVLEHVLLVAIAKQAIRHITALDVHISRVSISPLTGSIKIRGSKIFNPRPFKERILADVPFVEIDFKSKTLFEKGIFYDLIEIHVRELNIVRSKNDIVNLAQIKALTPGAFQKKPKKRNPFGVDRYVIKLDRIKYIDYTAEEKDRMKLVELNIREEYKNVKKPSSVAKIIAFKIFFSGKLGNIGVDILKIRKDLAELAEQNKSLADEFANVAKEKMEKTKEVISETAEAVKGRMKKTKEAVKEKMEEMKETIEDVKETIKDKVQEIKEKR